LSILTKISVIIMVVASLVASVVFINMATVPTNYRAWFEQQRDAYQNLEAKLTEVNAALIRSQEKLARTQRELGEQIAQLRQQRDEAISERDTLAAKVSQYENEMASINTQLTEVKASLQGLRQVNEQLTQDLQTAYSNLNDVRGAKAELAGELQETLKRNELLEKNLMIVRRNYEEQKSQVETLNDKLREVERLVPGGIAAADSEPIAPAGLAGTVTTVRGNIASVNIGSAQGIKEGMKLIVYRGDQFVGHLKVEQVDVNQAAGMVTEKQLDPMQGDRVTSAASLNSVN
jgi:myosin heavy subunit